MKEYSLEELQNIATDIHNFINSEEELGTRLLFNLRTNIKRIGESVDIIKEDFEKLTEEQQTKYQQFQQKRFEILQDFDADIKELDNGTISIENADELNNNEDFRKEIKSLKQEYVDLLKELEKNELANREIARKKVAQVDFKIIDIDEFPVKVNHLPYSFLEFVND